MHNFMGVMFSFIYVFIIILASKFFEKISKEASRKFIHIMVVNFWIIIMIFCDSTIAAVIPALSFVIINFLSKKYNIIKHMERDDVEADGYGTVYYAISALVLVVISFGFVDNKLVGLAAIIIMGYADGLAGLIGQTIKSKEYKVFGYTKTVVGSLVMFIATFIIVAVYLTYMQTVDWLVKSVIISFVIAIIEAISVKGTDNITVPMSALLLLLIFG